MKKKVPEKLLTEGDALSRAKNIYAFVQNHFTWNEKFGIFGKARVKEAFENRKGSVSEINMSLINLLNAADINTNLMLLSTRQRGLPKKIHPVISDFNYFVAKLKIDGKDYLLDATDKYLPFGMLPFRALNHYGRVMDFKKDSYWYNIDPYTDNKYQIRGYINFDVEGDKAMGVLNIVNTGYNAMDSYKFLNENNEEEYLEEMERSINGDFSITSYKLVEEKSDERKLTERFKFEVENIIEGNMVYMNPFFVRFFTQNPFTLEERNYPIDFGYPRSYKYQINMVIPEGYTVHELPESKIINLGEKLASLKFYSKQVSNQISILFELNLDVTLFPPEDYFPIKEVFKHVVDVQNNSLIVLKKE